MVADSIILKKICGLQSFIITKIAKKEIIPFQKKSDISNSKAQLITYLIKILVTKLHIKFYFNGLIKVFFWLRKTLQAEGFFCRTFPTPVLNVNNQVVVSKIVSL